MGISIHVKHQGTFLKLLKFKTELQTTIDLMFIGGLMGAVHKIKTPNNFIFPALSNNDFKNIDGNNDFTKISMEQYKKLKHATIVYNRKLKIVGSFCELEISLSFHVYRHSFTNLLLNMENVNLYDISQSLEHNHYTELYPKWFQQ